jgi:hypothetical protein
MNDSQSRLRGVVAALVVAMTLFTRPAVAHAAAEGGISIAPVGTTDPYFTLSLSPGAAADVTVELANAGAGRASGTLYPADVYTIVNGGFGARLRAEAPVAVGTWIADARPSTIDLAPGEVLRRTFRVSVPTTATSGEHITSVVVEDQAKVKSGRALTLSQVSRRALPIVIDVPGARVVGLAIGDASVTTVARHTVIAVEVTNSGNVREHPAGNLIVTHPDGHLTTLPVKMGTVYPGDTTTVTASFAGLLPAGRYTVSLELADAAVGVSVKKSDLPLVVHRGQRVVPSGGAAEAEISRAAPGLPVGLIAGIAIGLALAGGTLTALGVRRRRHSAQAGA